MFFRPWSARRQYQQQIPGPMKSLKNLSKEAVSMGKRLQTLKTFFKRFLQVDVHFFRKSMSRILMRGMKKDENLSLALLGFITDWIPSCSLTSEAAARIVTCDLSIGKTQKPAETLRLSKGCGIASH